MADPDNPVPASATATDSSTKTCRRCALQIPDKADLCNHCHGHQGKRVGWALNIGTPVLALLIALISVSTQSGAIAWKGYTSVRGNEDIRCRLLTLDGESGTIRLFVTNAGTRDGAIGDVRLLLPAEAAPKVDAFTEPMEVIEGDRLIRAGESTELVLRGVASRVPAVPGRIGRVSSFALVVEAIRFRGGTRDVTVRFDGTI